MVETPEFIMTFFKPKILSAFKDYNSKKLANDLVAGLIVAIIALPLSIALAIASGVTPEKGLYTAIVAGFVIALFGGSNVNISGPTAAFATIVAGIVATHGIAGLTVATVMAGIILILMGILKFGSLIKYIPYTITTGFTSGIAVTIAIGQLKDFCGLTYPAGTHTVETAEKVSAVAKNISTINFQAVLVGLIALAVMIVWPKINKKIPGSLIAVILGVVIVKAFKMEVNTIGDLYTISRTLPKFSFPGLSLELVRTLLPSAFTIALLAGIESLLSCVVSDGMIGDKHNPDTELVAQGLGNICSGLFGGIPATGAIARTAANVKNGGRTPVSGIVHAIVLLLVLVVLMPYAAWIPMPVIAAVLFMVAYNMSEWRHFVEICKTAPKSDIIVLVLTFVLTVVFDLVVAIEIGMLVAVILFVKRMAEVMSVQNFNITEEDNIEIIHINGPMFFATADRISDLAVSEETKSVIFDMNKVSALDVSAYKSLVGFCDTCLQKNIKIVFAATGNQPMKMMKKAEFTCGREGIIFVENIESAISVAKK